VKVFVDTSALYALLVGTEAEHPAVTRSFRELLEEQAQMLTSSYVVVEASALLQHRFGLAPVRDLVEHILPVLDVQWISEGLHRKATARLLREDRRNLSLVDCVSFELMHELRLKEALALDDHFREAGFRLKPRLDPPS
jgi:predicted nucleic acid-binding protein